MTILLLLIPMSVALLVLAVWAFTWAVRRDQFEELETPALDILIDDDKRDDAPAPERMRHHRQRAPDDAD